MLVQLADQEALDLKVSLVHLDHEDSLAQLVILEPLDFVVHLEELVQLAFQEGLVQLVLQDFLVLLVHKVSLDYRASQEGKVPLAYKDDLDWEGLVCEG